MAKPPSDDLQASYYFYSTILALKLVALGALAAIDPTCFPCKICRKSVSDLKHLAPFWLISSFYIMTEPDETNMKMILRTYAIARLIIAMDYLKKLPKPVIQTAMALSFAVTGYMATWVAYFYREAM